MSVITSSDRQFKEELKLWLGIEVVRDERDWAMGSLFIFFHKFDKD